MQNKASLKLRAAACPPSLDYRIAGNRPTVKGAEGAAKPFTLDGRAVFCYVPLLRHPVRVIDRKLGVDHRPVLSPARPLFCDVQHGQIQHLEQAVIGRKNRLGFGHFSQLTVESLDGVGGIDQPSELFAFCGAQRPTMRF